MIPLPSGTRIWLVAGITDIPALYVAFTRATRELLVTFYRENSISRHMTYFVETNPQERWSNEQG